MAYTDDDEKDLKAIAKGSFMNKDGGREGAYERQFGKRKDAKAGPKTIGSDNPANDEARKAAGMKCGGQVKKFAKGGSVRGDGVAQRGKTKGRNI